VVRLTRTGRLPACNQRRSNPVPRLRWRSAIGSTIRLSTSIPHDWRPRPSYSRPAYLPVAYIPHLNPVFIAPGDPAPGKTKRKQNRGLCSRFKTRIGEPDNSDKIYVTALWTSRRNSPLLRSQSVILSCACFAPKYSRSRSHTAADEALSDHIERA
jgi:hypothetical protein